MTSRRAPRAGLLPVGAASLCAVLLTTGCTASAGPATSPTPVATGAFSGPWADVLAWYDSTTDSSFAHQAFRDSVVTEAEAQEGMALIQACYVANGYAVEYDRFGYETATSTGGTGDPAEVMSMCAFADGGVVALFDQIRLNPDRVDTRQRTVDCLIASGLAPAEFTVDDLVASESSDSGPPVAGGPVATACLRDPLGLADGQ